jgi:hypothetical protein
VKLPPHHDPHPHLNQGPTASPRVHEMQMDGDGGDGGGGDASDGGNGEQAEAHENGKNAGQR